MKKYELGKNDSNIKITLSLPIEMIQDIAKYATVHGRTAPVDIRLRLARSLEKDFELEIFDSVIAQDETRVSFDKN